MRYRVMKTNIAAILFIFVLLSSCRRTYIYQCTNPQMLLQQKGFEHSEWDTIITNVYNKDFQPPVIRDTFITDNLSDLLTINLDESGMKDFEIILPSASRIYKLYDIVLTARTGEAEKGKEADCYNDVSYVLDGQHGTSANARNIVVQLAK